MVKEKKYTKEILLLIESRDNAKIIGEYSKLNRETRIYFKCICGNEHNKVFRSIKEDSGFFCKDCTLKKSIIKINQKNLELYGVKCVFESEEIKNKIKENNLKKYGVEYHVQTKDFKDKIIKINLEKYGVKNQFQNPSTKLKIKDTLIKKYGVEYPMQSNFIKDKFKNTVIKKYGVKHHMLSNIFKDKIRLTNLKRYGYGCTLENPIIKNKSFNTNLLRYGEKIATMNKNIYNKIIETNLIRYGVKNPMQNFKIFKKCNMSGFRNKIFKLPSDKIIYCQGYEPFALRDCIKLYNEDDIICGLKKYIPTFWWTDYKNTKHKYYPDIYIKSLKKIIEVKSIYTFNLHKNKVNKCRESVTNAGYNFECWIYDKKGNRINN